jgi:uncharacterized membrane-anchored protein
MYLENLIYSWIRPNMDTPNNNMKIEMSRQILSVIIFIIALIVSWDCNKEVTGVLKYLYLLIAGMFNSLYLVFYFIYRIILGNKCY